MMMSHACSLQCGFSFEWIELKVSRHSRRSVGGFSLCACLSLTLARLYFKFGHVWVVKPDALLMLMLIKAALCFFYRLSFSLPLKKNFIFTTHTLREIWYHFRCWREALVELIWLNLLEIAPKASNKAVNKIWGKKRKITTESDSLSRAIKVLQPNKILEKVCMWGELSCYEKEKLLLLAYAVLMLFSKKHNFSYSEKSFQTPPKNVLQLLMKRASEKKEEKFSSWENVRSVEK